MPIHYKFKRVEWDMTPMIDLVFLLIVFFTLVLNFATADQNERVKLPISELAQPPDLPPTEPITLHVLSNGNVIYNGNEHSLTELKRPVEHQLRFLKHIDIPLDTVTVIIRADAHSPSGHVFDVIGFCNDSGLPRFVLRTKQKKE